MAHDGCRLAIQNGNLVFNRILVPVTTPQVPSKPLAQVLELAREHCAELIVLRVIKPELTWSPYDGMWGAIPLLSDAESREYLARAIEDLKPVVDAAERAGISYRLFCVAQRDISDAVLNTARAKDCDLIVLLARTRLPPLERWWPWNSIHPIASRIVAASNAAILVLS